MKPTIQYILLLILASTGNIYAMENAEPVREVTTQLLYEFSLSQPSSVILHHWDSEASATKMTLTDSEKNIIDIKYGSWDIANSPNIYQSYIKKILPAGTYTLRSESLDGGKIMTCIEKTPFSITVKSDYAEGIHVPIEVGKHSSNFSFIDARNTEEHNGSLSGYNYGILFSRSNDVYYHLTLEQPMDIIINHSLSTLKYATLIHLLTYKESYEMRDGEPYYYPITTHVKTVGGYWDYDKPYRPSSKANMQIQRLPAGDYLIYVEGSEYTTNLKTTTTNGIIVTSIEGRVPEGDVIDFPINIGEYDYDFSYSDKKDSYWYADNLDSYHIDRGADIFYQFTINSPMNVEISAKRSHVPTKIFLYEVGDRAEKSCIVWDAPSVEGLTLPAGTYIAVSKAIIPSGSIAEGDNIITNITGSLSTNNGSGTEEGGNISILKNIIRQITPLVETSSISELKAGQQIKVTRYFDGLGRLEQTIQHGITPTKKDLVTLQEYDPFGRESVAWLPYVKERSSSDYFINPKNIKENIITQYANDTTPYSNPVYENSPLNRVTEQYGPGQHWHTNGKSVKTHYLTNNTTHPCLYFEAGANGIIKKGNYPSGELYVTEIKDEDDNTSYEFKDKLGQVILTRQLNGSEKYDTYYVYDEYGNLRYVLPPLAVDKLTSDLSDDNEIMQQYAYLYKYDHRNRCIKKRLPGCDWIYMVYDQADQLIFTQDGEQRKTNEWTFNKYDTFGRIVMTGLLVTAKTHEALRDMTETTLVVEKYQADHWSYSWNSLPELITPNTYKRILQVNYYDNYQFRERPEYKEDKFSFANKGAEYNTRYGDDNSTYQHKGLLTGTATGLLDNRNKFTYSVIYYDNKKRPIQTRSTNHIGGMDYTYTAYDFVGNPTKMYTEQTAHGITTKEQYTYRYDHAGRLKETRHRLNDSRIIMATLNEYDELGRLKTTRRNTYEEITNP
ncbi:DUF6443 domain-containing protein [Dysgonomonas sp. 25]|uniref:DUF6443 domain-containing protein n=1 Tax=Dysgonomonas sp. 25 TaxID=2302933 RepID=UPI0013D13792|nr:DUF6443 domain-containing protein [Dysgonomonas sp. 25]